INLIIFAGVGVAMIDVFCRVMERLEPARGRAPACWLALVGALRAELFYAFGLFQFALATGEWWVVGSEWSGGLCDDKLEASARRSRSGRRRGNERRGTGQGPAIRGQTSGLRNQR